MKSWSAVAAIALTVFVGATPAHAQRGGPIPRSTVGNGGGVRYYVRPNWGIRSECKVTVSSRVFTRVSFGVFYTLPSNWP